MSATNLTKNLKLPQFVASDKPSWLGDVNGAMLNIDNGIGTIKSDITKANDTASSAKNQSDANTVTLGNVNTELESIGNRVTALEAGGGTEQLEQKVKTNTDDIEALQTRADTFEDEIADNGSKINANTKSIGGLTPRIKSVEDNVTSLQTTTFGHSASIEKNTTDITSLTSTINGTAEIAGNAYNQSQSNKTAIADINTKLTNVKSLVLGTASPSNVTTSLKPTDILGIYEADTKSLYIPSLGIGGSSVTGSASGLTVGRLSLDPFGNLSSLNMIFNDVTYQMQNGYPATLTMSKTTGNNYIDIILKQSGGVSLAPPIIFTGLKCTFY